MLALPLTMLALLGCGGCSDQQIQGGGPTLEQPRNLGRWLSMAVLDDGKPAIAYYDVDFDALGYAVGTIRDDGGVSWSHEKVDSYPDSSGLNPGDAGWYASLAIGKDGSPWIAYQDRTNGTLKVAHKVDGAWTTLLADRSAGIGASEAGLWASLAIDPAGDPMVAHYDKADGALRVARWNGTAFTGEVVYDGEPVTAGGDTVAGDAGAYAKLRFAPDGTPTIAFYDAARGALRLARFTAGAWQVEIVDDTGDVGAWPDVVFDGTVTRIAYQDVGAQDLKLAAGSAGAWRTEVVDAGDYVGADTAMFVDGTDLGILYFDGIGNDLKVARRNGTTWATSTVAGDAGALGYHNETVKIGGVRYVGCYDYTKKTPWFAPLPG